MAATPEVLSLLVVTWENGNSRDHRMQIPARWIHHIGAQGSTGPFNVLPGTIGVGSSTGVFFLVVFALTTFLSFYAGLGNDDASMPKHPDFPDTITMHTSEVGEKDGEPLIPESVWVMQVVQGSERPGTEDLNKSKRP